MNNFFRKFDEAMTAAAYAEEGEFETARKILNEQKTVVFAFTGENSDSNAFRYAVSVCQRMEAKLDILYSETESSSAISQFKSELKKSGTDYCLTKTDGCVKEAALDYTNNRADILFVVVESWDGFDANCKKTAKIVNRSWINLKCPLVVVSDMVRA